MSNSGKRLREPVSWFLGMELGSRLRGIAVDRLQHDFNFRDWMDPRDPIDLRNSRNIWFDYVADTGDGAHAMRAIAYHLQRPVSVKRTTSTGHAESKLPANDTDEEIVLPRGRFLFLGGDAAYPASNTWTLEARVFDAFRATAPEKKGGAEIDLFGIPANHDYYDDLIGFNRLVRKTIAGPREPQTIPGYRQAQYASYVRVLLPHNWEIWGLDLTKDGIDFRQRKHFLAPVSNPGADRRLIVCTQRPPVVFGEDRSDAAHKRALEQLGLSTRFAEMVSGTEVKLDAAKTEAADGAVVARLDLSGDTHHYARYGGDSHRFAAVVSGGGGAFLHPTMDGGSIEKKVLFPKPEESREVVVKRLADWLSVFRSGRAWALAALLSVALVAGLCTWTAESHVFWLLDMNSARQDLLMGLVVLVSVIAPVLWLVYGRAPTGMRGCLEAHPVLDLLWMTLRVAVFFLLAVGLAIASEGRLEGYTVTGTLGMMAAVILLVAAFALAWKLSGRGFALTPLGVFHGVVQIVIPVSLVNGGLAVLAVVPIWIGAAWLMRAGFNKTGSGWWAVLVWMVSVSGTVSLAVVFEATREWSVVTGMLAFGVGVVTCVLNFGWYLLVSFLFGAHNNEAGSAVRCEDYKQFIRFHIDEHGVLTGYVIGVQNVRSRYETSATLVDSFEIGVRPRDA